MHILIDTTHDEPDTVRSHWSDGLGWLYVAVVGAFELAAAAVFSLFGA